MSDERRDALWDRLYNMDGFGLSDYLNQLYPFTDPQIGWRASQHGHDLFVRADGEIVFSWNRFDLWREKVSYYFDGFCDAIGEVGDERFSDVAVHYLARALFSRDLDRLQDKIQPVDIACKLILF